jgi:hypothetical protein
MPDILQGHLERAPVHHFGCDGDDVPELTTTRTGHDLETRCITTVNSITVSIFLGQKCLRRSRACATPTLCRRKACRRMGGYTKGDKTYRNITTNDSMSIDHARPHGTISTIKAFRAPATFRFVHGSHSVRIQARRGMVDGGCHDGHLGLGGGSQTREKLRDTDEGRLCALQQVERSQP